MFSNYHSELVKKYNFSSLITEEDNQLYKEEIDTLISNGDYWIQKGKPLYQTKGNLFESSSLHWLKLAYTFSTACKLYVEKDIPLCDYRSWGLRINNTIL